MTVTRVLTSGALVASVIICTMTFLLGCTTYSVEPVTQDLTWNQGRGYLTAKGKSILLRGALDSKSSDTLTFIVEIENTSSEPVLIGPNLFLLSGGGVENETVGPVDPEIQIGNISEQLEAHESKIRTTSWDAASSLLTAAVVISGSETKEQRLQREQGEREKNQDKQLALQEIQNLRSERSEYERRFLRTTTLQPKSAMRGSLKFVTGIKEGPINLWMHGKDEDVSLGFKVVKD